MSSTMIDDERLQELAAEFAKGIKTEEDLAAPLGRLMKLTLEKALNCRDGQPSRVLKSLK